MKLFIDSADLNEIKEAYSWKIIEGVTTNPSLMKKAIEKLNKKGEKISLESYIKKILKVAGKTPVSLEVTTNDYKNMIEEGKNIFNKFKKYGNTYIKIPVDPCLNLSCKKDFDGIKAIYKLSKLKIPINCTLIFSPEQALFAAKAGAKIISPF
ncbi:MAG: transaldolase family protein, partial [Candidatus Pacearchaeota archaeon]